MERLEFINTINAIVSFAEYDIRQQTGIRMRLLLVNDLPPDECSAIGMAQVIAHALGMTMSHYKVRSRRQKYVHLRHLTCYFIRQYYPALTLNDIKKMVGHRDHTTVNNCIAMTKKLLSDTDNIIFKPKYDQVLQAVTQWIEE